jgi:hypothetical protein
MLFCRYYGEPTKMAQLLIVRAGHDDEIAVAGTLKRASYFIN